MNNHTINGTWKNNKLHGQVKILFSNNAKFKYLNIYIEDNMKMESELRAFINFQMEIDMKGSFSDKNFKEKASYS